MSGNIALYSRLLLVFVLVCAAVMPFIMCSDAARASPIITQVDNRVKHNILWSLFTPSRQNPAETGLETGTISETEMSGNNREASSIIHHWSSPQFTGGSFSYSQNSPDYSQSGRVQRGHSAGGVRPTNSVFTRYSQHRRQSLERQQPTMNDLPFLQKLAQSRNSHNSHPRITRKSFQRAALSSFSQAQAPESPQKSYNNENSPNKAEEKTVWLSFDSSRFSSWSGRHQSALLPKSTGHYSGYKETNGERSTSNRIQSSRFLSFASQTAPRAPSISNSLDASVIKSNPSPEKLTSSITDVSQWLNLVSSSDTPRYKNLQSYPFKDSHNTYGGREVVKRVTGDGPSTFFTALHEQGPSAAQAYSRLSSQLEQSHSKDPTKEVQQLHNNASPLYHNTIVAQYGAQTHSLTRYQPLFMMHSRKQTPAQLPLHPALGKGKTLESLASVLHTDSQYNHATSSEKSVVGRPAMTRSGSVHSYTPGQSLEINYGLTGFENPTWKAVKEPFVQSPSDRHSSDVGKDYELKNPKIFPPLALKYSFRPRGASTTTQTPAKLERTPTDDSSPSPDILNIIQTTTTFIPRPLTSSFREVQALLPESDASMDGNQSRKQFRISKRIHGLKGFGSRPLEGARTLVREPDKSATLQQDLEGFELRSSQIWHPKSSRVHRWHNQAGETEQITSNASTQSPNKLWSEDLNSLLQNAGSTLSIDKQNNKIHTPLGFQPVQNTTEHANDKTHYPESTTTASPAHNASSAYLRSAGSLKAESSPEDEPGTPNKIRPAEMKVSLLNTSTISTVKGRRVKGKHSTSKKLTSDNVHIVHIVRLPKVPIRVTAVTYADIFGSASFSGVRATAQIPTTPPDEDSPNTTTKHSVGYWASTFDVHRRENMSISPEVNADNEVEDFSGDETTKQGVISEDVNGRMETFYALAENEGSGSGGFNTSVLSADATESQALSEGILELDYLQLSTKNVSFKSLKQSHSDT